jgi:multiple sugar transport system substrate-binding protein|tara:strand:- start:7291 stop:8529 length:1239 start_codon:yes stop_codon:yes gene_type:complete
MVKNNRVDGMDQGADNHMEAARISKPVEISFWRHSDIKDDPVLLGLIDKFNRTHRDIKVEYREVPWDQEHDLLLAAAAEGRPPDCSDVVEYWIGEWVKKDLLEPLDDYIDQWDGSDDLIDGYWDWVRAGPDQPRYIVGGGMGCDVIYYRADLFEAANLEPPNTYEDLLVAAKKLTRPPRCYGLGMRGSRIGHRFWGDFMRSQGLNFGGSSGNFTLNIADAVAANQWYIDLYATHRVTPPSAITDSFPQHLQQLISGEAAIIMHTTHLASLLDEALGQRVAACRMPAGPNGRHITFYPQNHAIYRESRNKEAAWVFISWLAEAEQVEAWCRNPQRPLLPNVKSLLGDSVYSNDRFYKVSLDSMKDWGSDPWFHPQFGPFVERVWPQTFQRALRGDISSQEMMDIFQDHFTGSH